MRKYLLLIYFFLLLVILIPQVVQALTEAAAHYNRAGALYHEGKYQEALALYEQLIEQGIANPDLYYNAANTAYRSDLLGKSVLYLERALRLAPSDEDAIANLTFINSIKQDKELVNDNPVVAFFVGHYNAANINTAALWSGFSFAIAMFCATMILFTAGWKRFTAIVASALCGLIFLLSTGMLVEKTHRRNTVIEAVILEDSAKAFSGPGPENTHIFTVHEGTKIVIQRHQDSWNRIRLKSGAGGWIRADAMEVI